MMPGTETYSLDDFNFDFPRSLVAQEPANPRDSSRLMVIPRNDSKGTLVHSEFLSLPFFLKEGDVLVRNNSKVIPARLFLDSGEVIVLYRSLSASQGMDTSASRWECLVEQGSLKEAGKEFSVENTLFGKVLQLLNPQAGGKGEHTVIVEFSNPEVLGSVGKTPIPPYIKEFHGSADKYQTVYAKIDGSSAAPTAGLHFTDRVFAKLKEKGISIVDITLHVSLDTFMPVTSSDPSQHKIYTEYIQISKESANSINEARRVIAVGTTSVRTLEQTYARLGKIDEYEGWADLFIYPGKFTFKVVEGMITNFHYPRSSNLMLVGAFAGVDTIKRAYQEAFDKKYRLFSFGDSTLII